MLKLEHIGIAIKSMEEALPLFEKLLNTPCYKTETVDREKVRTAFFNVGKTKVELLEGTGPESVITRFVERKGEGIHHLAFEVEDIRLEMQRLQEQGFQLLQEEPSRGADNKLICFLHPKGTRGVLIEICQEIK